MGFVNFTGGRFVLAKDTAATVKMGPFIDTDGNAVTTLSIAYTDVRLSKNDANFVEKSETSSASHDENGYYDVDLDGTDTNTFGNLFIAIHVAGALPVFRFLECDQGAP